ncbi:MAG: SPOR domain-containing protein, partial [Nitrosomonas sp.]|nr:SPOR domain-containing protein [Nitrosomonas sp.]
MTQNISEEELLLRKRARRRLLGATTLVIAAVIILPMIFDEEPKLEQKEMEINFSPDGYTTDFSPTLLDSDDLLVADPYSEVPTEQPLSVETMIPPSVAENQEEIIAEQNRIPIP